MAERLAPSRTLVADFLNGLGIIFIMRGQLARADHALTRAASIYASVDSPFDLARALTNAGVVAESRGDYSLAESHWRRSLRIFHDLSPDSGYVASALQNLGSLERERGELESARSYYEKALDILNREDPSSLDAARTLYTLGVLAADRGDLDEAASLAERALQISEARSPADLNTSASLMLLGDVAAQRKDLIGAGAFYYRALDINEKISPDSWDVTMAHTRLSDLALQLGDHSTAELFASSSLGRRREMAVGQHTAENLHQLGLIYRRAARRGEALACFREALDDLEVQGGRLGGSESTRMRFRDRYGEYYKDYIDLLIELDRPADALEVLERSRARSFLAMLAERDMVFTKDLPPALENEQKSIDIECDRAQEEIGSLRPKEDAARFLQLSEEIRRLRNRKRDFAAKTRSAAPRYAALRYPQPLDLAATRAALDPGTLLLSYSVGSERALLFIVEPARAKGEGLTVLALPTSEGVLREGVEGYRNLLDVDGSRADTERHLLERSRSLYDSLIKPAEELIGRYDRLLILPDGPLHTLPFAALVRQVKNTQPQYLVEWKPIHTAVSATVYKELRKPRAHASKSASVVVAAFGDPKYPTLPEKRISVRRGESEVAGEPDLTEDEFEDFGDPQLRSVARGRFRLDPLPASRKEVEQITSLYAPRSVAYLGPDATEEKAKSIGKDVPLIHFACHAVVNERFPLDSALVFTIPEKPKKDQDNGVLQAWEIFERVRIDADLVTLSACESGLGEELGGEGLIGLTRAFQYAGAHTVLASLWKVEDRATGELMKRFYTHLKGGKSKDEALRLAQIDLIRSGSNLAYPRNWAAFQLNGDWK